MGMRTFLVNFECEVELQWRSIFYKLYTPTELAEHIAYNMLVNNAELSHLDWLIAATEIKAPAPKKQAKKKTAKKRKV
jgi:hypothetical protein